MLHLSVATTKNNCQQFNRTDMNLIGRKHAHSSGEYTPQSCSAHKGVKNVEDVFFCICFLFHFFFKTVDFLFWPTGLTSAE